MLCLLYFLYYYYNHRWFCTAWNNDKNSSEEDWNAWTLYHTSPQLVETLLWRLFQRSGRRSKDRRGGRWNRFNHLNRIDKKSSVSLANVHRNKINGWPKTGHRGVTYRDSITLFSKSGLQRCVCEAVRTSASMIRLIGVKKKKKKNKKNKEKSAASLLIETSSYRSVSFFKLHEYALKKSQSSNEIFFFFFCKAGLSFELKF